MLIAVELTLSVVIGVVAPNVPLKVVVAPTPVFVIVKVFAPFTVLLNVIDPAPADSATFAPSDTGLLNVIGWPLEVMFVEIVAVPLPETVRPLPAEIEIEPPELRLVAVLEVMDTVPCVVKPLATVTVAASRVMLPSVVVVPTTSLKLMVPVPP